MKKRSLLSRRTLRAQGYCLTLWLLLWMPLSAAASVCPQKSLTALSALATAIRPSALHIPETVLASPPDPSRRTFLLTLAAAFGFSAIACEMDEPRDTLPAPATPIGAALYYRLSLANANDDLGNPHQWETSFRYSDNNHSYVIPGLLPEDAHNAAEWFRYYLSLTSPQDTNRLASVRALLYQAQKDRIEKSSSDITTSNGITLSTLQTSTTQITLPDGSQRDITVSHVESGKPFQKIPFYGELSHPLFGAPQITIATETLHYFYFFIIRPALAGATDKISFFLGRPGTVAIRTSLVSLLRKLFLTNDFQSIMNRLTAAVWHHEVNHLTYRHRAYPYDPQTIRSQIPEGLDEKDLDFISSELFCRIEGLKGPHNLIDALFLLNFFSPPMIPRQSSTSNRAAPLSLPAIRLAASALLGDPSIRYNDAAFPIHRATQKLNSWASNSLQQISFEIASSGRALEAEFSRNNPSQNVLPHQNYDPNFEIAASASYFLST